MTPEWEQKLARVEVERKEAELKLDNAMRRLAEVHANQIDRDRKLGEGLLRAIAALLEGLKETPKNGDTQ